MPAVLFLIFFCAGLAVAARTLGDPDVYWHLAAGDLIRAGGLPASDPWSHTAGDQPWFNLSWGFDAGLSALFGAGGFAAVAVAAALVYGGVAAATGAAALRASQSLLAAFAAAALAGLVMAPALSARPHLVTWLFVIAFYMLLRRGRGPALVALPAIMLAWVNLHGGFLAGFTVLGAFFIEALIGRDRARATAIALAGAASAGALLVNPYGAGVFEGAGLTMSSVLKGVIDEWRPLAFDRPSPAVLFVAALFFVSAAFEKKIPLADKILAFSWTAAALASARMTPVAAILAAPYLAQGLALRLVAAPFLARLDARAGADFSRPTVYGPFAALAVMLAALAFAPPAQRLVAGGAFAAPPPASAPEDAAAVLGAGYASLRLYNEYDFGGYLVWRLRGAPAVFFDGRADTAYPRAVLEDGLTLGLVRGETTDARWRALVERYAIEGFFVRPGSRLDARLAADEDWRAVHEDRWAALYVRADLARR